MGKPRSMETAEVVAHFKAGISIKELALRNMWSMAKVERAIRRWMIRYPQGKKSPERDRAGEEDGC